MSQSFHNKVVWLTGASSGIGRELAIQLAQKGASLLLSSRSKGKLEEVKQEALAFTGRVEVLPLDYAEEAQMKQSVEAALTLYAQIDHLILCAGISQRSFITDTNTEVYRKLMEVNFFGPIALTKALLPHMISQQGGHITVISSVAGKFGTPMRSGYSASKQALHGFFESLHAEMYQHNIRVSVLCPGYIQTDITLKSLTGDGSAYGKVDESLEHGMPVKRCSQKIIRAIVAKKREAIIAQTRERTAVYLKRFIPGLLFILVRKLNPVE